MTHRYICSPRDCRYNMTVENIYQYSHGHSMNENDAITITKHLGVVTYGDQIMRTTTRR